MIIFIMKLLKYEHEENYWKWLKRVFVEEESLGNLFENNCDNHDELKIYYEKTVKKFGDDKTNSYDFACTCLLSREKAFKNFFLLPNLTNKYQGNILDFINNFKLISIVGSEGDLTIIEKQLMDVMTNTDNYSENEREMFLKLFKICLDCDALSKKFIDEIFVMNNLNLIKNDFDNVFFNFKLIKILIPHWWECEDANYIYYVFVYMVQTYEYLCCDNENFFNDKMELKEFICNLSNEIINDYLSSHTFTKDPSFHGK